MLLWLLVWSIAAWLVAFAFLAIRYVLLAIAYRQIGESIESWEALPEGFRIRRQRPSNLTMMAANGARALVGGIVLVPACLLLVVALEFGLSDFGILILCAIAIGVTVGAFALDRVATPAIYRWWKSGY